MIGRRLSTTMVLRILALALLCASCAAVCFDLVGTIQPGMPAGISFLLPGYVVEVGIKSSASLRLNCGTGLRNGTEMSAMFRSNTGCLITLGAEECQQDPVAFRGRICWYTLEPFGGELPSEDRVRGNRVQYPLSLVVPLIVIAALSGFLIHNSRRATRR